MRRSSVLITSLFATAAMHLPAFAADNGMYRPGSPYHSVTATAATACEAQCHGDAQCKGWNFVRVLPRAAEGVCEFNSQAVSPIPSRISVSGKGAGQMRGARLSQGGTNTVRVGSPAMPKATPTRPQSRTAPQARTQQTSPARRVVRQPVPQQAQPRGTVARNPQQTLTQQQQMQRAMTGIPQVPQTRQMQRPAPPRFQHNLDGGRMNPAMTPQRMPQNGAPNTGIPSEDMQRRLMEYQMRERMRQQAANPNAAPGMQNPQGAPMMDPRMKQQQGPQGPLTQAPTRQRQSMPQAPTANVGAPGAQGPNYRDPNAMGPRTPQTAPQQQAQAQTMPPRRPMTVSQAEQSLFGSLYDDVVEPKPITETEARNPDAPIATVTAVPVKKVTEETLFGLAGGRR